MVSALIIPRSATTQTWPIAEAAAQASVARNPRVVTSAVLPGHISEQTGRACWSTMTPTIIWI